MSFATLNPNQRMLMQEFSDADKNLVAVRTQREQHEIILREIHDLLKELKSDRTKVVSKIYGGNIIVSKSKDEIIKSLNARKMEIENALAGLREQEQYRMDYYGEVTLKIARLFCSLCDMDTLKILKEKITEDRGNNEWLI